MYRAFLFAVMGLCLAACGPERKYIEPWNPVPINPVHPMSVPEDFFQASSKIEYQDSGWYTFEENPLRGLRAEIELNHRTKTANVRSLRLYRNQTVYTLRCVISDDKQTYTDLHDAFKTATFEEQTFFMVDGGSRPVKFNLKDGSTRTFGLYGSDGGMQVRLKGTFLTIILDQLAERECLATTQSVSI